jgi:hypothetical protein
MLGVTNKPFMLSVVVLNVIMLIVIMLSVVAPQFLLVNIRLSCKCFSYFKDTNFFLKKGNYKSFNFDIHEPLSKGVHES